MSPDLETSLKAKHPRIMRLLHARRGRMPITHYGIECGEGWFAIIDDLCTQLQAGTDAGTFEQPTIAQVKEKLGKLEVYMAHERPAYDALIYEARYRAWITCEICGAPSVKTGVDSYARFCETHDAAHGAGA